MNSFDTAVKAVSLASALIGAVAIGIEQLSLRRRLYAETMRQLQLVKLRYEIEKLIRDGQLSSELYESVLQGDPAHIRTESSYIGEAVVRRLTAPAALPDVILLLLPTLIALALTMLVHDWVAFRDCRPSLAAFAFWILGQGVASAVVYAWAVSRIRRTVVRRLASLMTGVAVFLLVGTLIVLGYPC